MKAEEVDAILEREDLRLAVQAQAQRLDVLLDPLEDLPEQQLVAADDVEVVHVTAIDEAEVIPQPVVEVVQIEQGGASSTNRCAMMQDASAGGIGV